MDTTFSAGWPRGGGRPYAGRSRHPHRAQRRRTVPSPGALSTGFCRSALLPGSERQTGRDLCLLPIALQRSRWSVHGRDPLARSAQERGRVFRGDALACVGNRQVATQAVPLMQKRQPPSGWLPFLCASILRLEGQTLCQFDQACLIEVLDGFRTAILGHLDPDTILCPAQA